MGELTIRGTWAQQNLMEWSRRVADCRSSELSVTRWCIEHGVKPKTYPDVVTIAEFCAMLCIGDTYARKLLRKNLVGHYVIRHTYYIPKAIIIDFILSPNYLQVLNRFRRDTNYSPLRKQRKVLRCLRNHDYDITKDL